MANFRIFFFTLLFANSVSAETVRRLVWDLDETLIQRDQEFAVKDGKLVPLLEEVPIKNVSWEDGSRQDRVYYLRAGARELLEFNLHAKTEIDFISYSHQARLNAVLKAVKLSDGRSLLEHAALVFGREASFALSRLADPSPRSGEPPKDAQILDQPWSRDLSDRLKGLEVWYDACLDGMTYVPSPVGSDVLILDDRPEVWAESQVALVYRSRYQKRDKAFWKKYLAAMLDPLPIVRDAFNREQFLGELDIERYQYRLLIGLIRDSAKSEFPNDYGEWNLLTNVPLIAATERAHFPYLIADLFKEDSATNEILFLGRDTHGFETSVRAVQKALGLESKIHYLPISRVLAARSGKHILEILRNEGVDVDGVSRGEKHLRVVDTGYEGTVPKLLLGAFFEGDPDWKTKAKSVQAFLFTSGTVGGHSAGDFDSLEAYRKAGAFIEPSPHQFRFGPNKLREVVIHWEHERPAEILRTFRFTTGEDSRILSEKSHPTEVRYSNVLRNFLAMYFSTDEMVASLRRRLDFVRGAPGHYPSGWREQEPELRAIPPGSAVDIQLAKFEAGAWALTVKHIQLLMANGARYHRPELAPPFVRFTSDRLDPEKGMQFLYDPAFDHEKVKTRSAELSYWQTHRALEGTGGLVNLGDANPEVASHYKNALAHYTDLERTLLLIAREEMGGQGSLFRNRMRAGFSPPQIVERHMHWLAYWLHSELQKDYDPIVVAAQLYYLLVARLGVFRTNDEDVARQLVNFVFLRKGLRAPDWSLAESPLPVHQSAQATYDWLASLSGRPAAKEGESAGRAIASQLLAVPATLVKSAMRMIFNCEKNLAVGS